MERRYILQFQKIENLYFKKYELINLPIKSATKQILGKYCAQLIVETNAFFLTIYIVDSVCKIMESTDSQPNLCSKNIFHVEEKAGGMETRGPNCQIWQTLLLNSITMSTEKIEKFQKRIKELENTLKEQSKPKCTRQKISEMSSKVVDSNPYRWAISI